MCSILRLNNRHRLLIWHELVAVHTGFLLYLKDLGFIVT